MICWMCGNRKVSTVSCYLIKFFDAIRIRWIFSVDWMSVAGNVGHFKRSALSNRFDSIQSIWMEMMENYLLILLNRCFCWKFTYFNSSFLFSPIHHFTLCTHDHFLSYRVNYHCTLQFVAFIDSTQLNWIEFNSIH